MAAITAAQRTEIFKIVTGLFSAAPGAAYLTEFASVVEGGYSTQQLSQALANNTVFTSGIMGGKVTPAAQVQQLMSNFGLTYNTGTLAAAGTNASDDAQTWLTGQVNGMAAAGRAFGAIVYHAVTALSDAGWIAANPVYASVATTLTNKAAVAQYYSVTQGTSSTSLTQLQAVLAPVTATTPVATPADLAAVVTAATSADTTFTLTMAADIFPGGSGNDVFVATYNDGLTGTLLGAVDILAGNAGNDLLLITPIGVSSITPADSTWTNITGIERVTINTTLAGAQTITTGALFEAAFAAGGVNLSTTSTGGAITIDMNSVVSFTGAATITTTSTDGAQTITTGSGLATVNATSGAGALTITGANLATVNATTAGAGAQNITITSTGAGAVIVTAIGNSGAQTISTGAGSDTVTVTTSAGAGNSVTTNAGNDTITLLASAAAALSNTISGGAGVDSIALVTGALAAVDTVVHAKGDGIVSTVNTTTGAIAAGQTITFGSGLDIVTGFVGGTDILNVTTAGAAVTGIGQNEAAFAATQNIFLSGTYAAGVFTIAADGAGADTLLLDTTAAADQNIATADTWILLVGTNSGSLISSTFI